jgi:DNA polymerase III epsilon subunit-like protein
MSVIAPKFLEFIGDAPVVAHNGADFDFPFMNHELEMLGLPPIPRPQQLDSIVIARNRVFGPKSYSLDALAKWYGISLTARADAHGALIDAEILAKVFLELENTAPAPDIRDVIARQHDAFLAHPKTDGTFPHRTFAPHDDELANHNKFMEKIVA